LAAGAPMIYPIFGGKVGWEVQAILDDTPEK